MVGGLGQVSQLEVNIPFLFVSLRHLQTGMYPFFGLVRALETENRNLENWNPQPGTHPHPPPPPRSKLRLLLELWE